MCTSIGKAIEAKFSKPMEIHLTHHMLQMLDMEL
jgi:hypothetical protein